MEYNNVGANVTIDFFNLYRDGDTAIVRLLHTSVDKIERKNIHYIKVNGKNKIVNCVGGQDCPCCLKATGPLDAAADRIFIHLYDYGDNKEKVWNRTPTILPQLAEIASAWGNLSDCVLKITRVGNEYPKYNIVPLNPTNYTKPSSDRVDINIAYRFYMTRSKEELEQFYATGIMPEHKKAEFVPKEQYNNQTNTYSEAQTVTQKPLQSEVPSQFSGQMGSESTNTTVNNTDSVQSNPFGNSNPFGSSDPFANFIPKRV